MSKRYVTLGGGARRVTLGQYVEAWKTTLAAPASAKFKGSPCDPTGYLGAYTRDQVLEQFRAGLAERINRHLAWYGRGRKWSTEWWWSTWRAARDLNTPRLVIHWLPPELRDRFAHRMAGSRLLLEEVA